MSTLTTNKVTECGVLVQDTELTRAYNLFIPYIPENAILTIEETDAIMCSRYYVSMEYKSRKTGRKISILAKGNTLPTAENDVLRYYLTQIVLTPAEVGREFSRIYFRERVARQDAFLFGGGEARGNDVRVSNPNEEADRLEFDDYN